MKLIQTHKYTRIHCRQVLYFFKSISHPFLSSSENIIIHLYIKNTKQMIKKNYYVDPWTHTHIHTKPTNKHYFTLFITFKIFFNVPTV